MILNSCRNINGRLISAEVTQGSPRSSCEVAAFHLTGTVGLRTLPAILFHCQKQHCDKFIRSDLVQADAKPQLQRGIQIDRPPKKLPSLGRLCRVQLVQRAVITPSTIVRCIVAELRIAQFIPAQRPMNEETQRGPLGPLAAGQFGSPVS